MIERIRLPLPKMKQEVNVVYNWLLLVTMVTMVTMVTIGYYGYLETADVRSCIHVTVDPEPQNSSIVHNLC